MPNLPIPTKAQWQSWSLPSKLTAIGTLTSILMGVFAVIAYFMPYTPAINSQKQSASHLNGERIRIPVVIRNGLSFDVRIDPQLEFYLLRPETPAMNSLVEAGIVRLEQPYTVTALNGSYPLSPNEEIQSYFTLPASQALTKALEASGFKLRVIVTNIWIDKYSEFKDVIFDQKTLERGIRITFYKEHNN